MLSHPHVKARPRYQELGPCCVMTCRHCSCCIRLLSSHRHGRAFFGQPVGNYETRHLTGGALVKYPRTASSCFRRPGGRLEFPQGGTWHEETPLESAERRGTVRGSLKVNRTRTLSLHHWSSTKHTLCTSEPGRQPRRALYSVVLEWLTGVREISGSRRAASIGRLFVFSYGGKPNDNGIRTRSLAGCIYSPKPNNSNSRDLFKSHTKKSKHPNKKNNRLPRFPLLCFAFIRQQYAKHQTTLALTDAAAALQPELSIEG